MLRLPSFFKYFLFAGFVVVSGFAGLKIYTGPVLHWLLVLFLLGLWGIVFHSQRECSATEHFSAPRKRIMFVSLPWILLTLSVFVAASANDWVGLHALPKYAALAFVLVGMMLYTPTNREVLVGLKALCLMALAALILLWLANAWNWLVFAPNRYGWIWAPPGVLWKAGIFLVPYFAWAIMTADERSGAQWFWLVLACLVAGADGSRTAAVASFLIWLAVVGLAVARFGFNGRTGTKSALIGMIMLLAMGGLNPTSLNPLHALYQSTLGAEVFLEEESILDAAEESLLEIPPPIREVGEDSARLKMLKRGFEGSVENFPVGAGFGTTTIFVPEIEGQMVVHMTYLQVLSDLGILGLLGYLGVFLVPVYIAFRKIRKSADRWGEFDGYVLPLGIVGIYLFSGLFHPISNEISEWAIVLVACALLVKWFSSKPNTA